MKSIQTRRNKLTFLAFVTVAALATVSAVSADHGGSDPYHYSAWTTGQIHFTVAGQGWSAHPQFINATNPDRADGYFCQKFGFFNCQVTGPTDTWVRSRGTCWTSTVGSGTSTRVTSSWSRKISSVSCPSSKPVLSTTEVQVASIPYVF